jgi:hypothetical protein
VTASHRHTTVPSIGRHVRYCGDEVVVGILENADISFVAKRSGFETPRPKAAGHSEMRDLIQAMSEINPVEQPR